MKDCRSCRSYKDCPGLAWFDYGAIRFCPYQILFIIANSDILLSGNWPPNPDSSSYTDPAIQSALKPEAYYTKPEEILGEVERRLSRTGINGKLLVAEVQAGYSELSPEARDALMYVKGWEKKDTSYSQWRSSRKYYKKVTKSKTT